MSTFIGDSRERAIHRRSARVRKFLEQFRQWPEDILRGHEHKFRQIGFNLDDGECEEKLKMLLWVCIQEARETMDYGGFSEDSVVEVFLTGEIESLRENQTYVFRRNDPLAQYGIGQGYLEMMGVSLEHGVRVDIQKGVLSDAWCKIAVGQSLYQDLHTMFGFRPLQRAHVFRGRNPVGKTGQGGEETFFLALGCWNIGFRHPELLSMYKLPDQPRDKRLSILRVPLRLVIDEYPERYSYGWFIDRGLSQAVVNSLEVVFCGNRLEGVVRNEQTFQQLVKSIRGQRAKAKKGR